MRFKLYLIGIVPWLYFALTCFNYFIFLKFPHSNKFEKLSTSLYIYYLEHNYIPTNDDWMSPDDRKLIEDSSGCIYWDADNKRLVSKFKGSYPSNFCWIEFFTLGLYKSADRATGIALDESCIINNSLIKRRLGKL
jgi:hypothetical protein